MDDFTPRCRGRLDSKFNSVQVATRRTPSIRGCTINDPPEKGYRLRMKLFEWVTYDFQRVKFLARMGFLLKQIVCIYKTQTDHKILNIEHERGTFPLPPGR